MKDSMMKTFMTSWVRVGNVLIVGINYKCYCRTFLQLMMPSITPTRMGPSENRSIGM